jgi:hypothetical protein
LAADDAVDAIPRVPEGFDVLPVQLNWIDGSITNATNLHLSWREARWFNGSCIVSTAPTHVAASSVPTDRSVKGIASCGHQQVRDVDEFVPRAG